MTALGKSLVFLNFTLSLMLAIWALGVWSNRIDFSNSTAKGNEGEFEKRRLVIDALYKKLPVAETAWTKARTTLDTEEKPLVADRVWYSDQLDRLRTKATVGDAVQQLAYAKQDDDKLGIKKGQLLLDRGTGRPLLEAIKDRRDFPLPSLEVLYNEERVLLADLEKKQNDHQKQILEAIALTERLTGTAGKKGLHQQLVDERRKRADVVAEQDLVEPLLVNTLVDAELVHKRHRALEARIEELKRVGVAARDR
jgi:hypothetical protein